MSDNVFDNISVNRYRGIKAAEVKDFRRINVFFGKNNCGKSSLLESIFLLTGQSNPILPLSVNAFRGYSSLQSVDDVRLNFYNLESDTPITLSSNGKNARHLSISLIQSVSKTIDVKSLLDTNSQSSEQYFGLKLSFDDNCSSEVIIKKDGEDKAKVNVSKQYKEAVIAEMLPARLSIGDIVAKRMNNIIKEKKKENVLSVLRVMEPRLVDIVVVDNTVLVDIGSEHFLPLNVMGDGMTKILMNIIAIYECANGVALIDEVDNGLHFSMMELLWKAMIAAAQENNVQLFVSTHNLDSIKGLNRVMQSGAYDLDIISAYKLVKSKESVLNALRYDADTLNYMIEQEIEVR